MTLGKRYRSKTRLLMDILKAVKEEGDATVTRLLFIANLSHPRLKEYLDELQGKGWIEQGEAEGKTVWRITNDGQKVLGELDRIERSMADFGLDL